MSMKFSRFLVVWFALLLGFSAQGAATQARLVVPVETVKAGETITVGVLLEMQAGWHTYWKNSGESGSATKIVWTLPEGVTAGDIQWPLPERTDSAGLVTFVHHDTAMLLVPLTVTSKAATGPLELKAKVSWLECEKVCVPGRTEVKATLQVASETKRSSEADLIKQWQAKLPKADASLKTSASWEGEVIEGKRNLLITITAPTDAAAWDFYPYRGEGFDLSPKSEKVSAKDKTFTIRKVVSTDDGKWPTEVKGLVVGGADADKPSSAFEASIVIASSSPVAAAESKSSPSAESPAPAVSKQSLGLMLFYAFLGGIILNIMPCVLPVISLKILGFVKQSQQDPQRVKMLGLIYGLGVIASFVVLALLVIGVQQAGKIASWGMQFQNTQFLVILTVLVTLIALNLFGVFEVTPGDNIMGAAGQLASKKGPSGAFFNGVLATVLATPCTAPFLGTALGFAFSQSAAIILLLFVTIGLGLAAPYVILSFQPNWLKFLPKPGAWMERFKILMGFPMLATAIWLFSLSAGHFGNKGVLWIGLLLVLIGLAAYIFGEFAQRGQKNQGLAKVIALVIALGSFGYILEGELQWRSPQRAEGKAGVAVESKVGIAWKAWSAVDVMEARKSGKVVFVDFTADWCTTCQWNKKTSIEIVSVKQKLDAIGAVTFLGDYTHEDPAIANELRKYDRAGVPLVLVFSPDLNTPPIVLPEILTESIVLEALGKAAPKKLTAAQ